MSLEEYSISEFPKEGVETLDGKVRITNTKISGVCSINLPEGMPNIYIPKYNEKYEHKGANISEHVMTKNGDSSFKSTYISGYFACIHVQRTSGQKAAIMPNADTAIIYTDDKVFVGPPPSSLDMFDARYVVSMRAFTPQLRF